MIQVSHLTKRYGSHTAVSDLSFSIEKGQIYGFLGPNGAGKSTTMNIMTGCLAATSGQVKIGGYDIFEQPRQAKRLLGYLPEQPPLYLDRTAWEYLHFVGRAKGIRERDLPDRVEQVMEETQIAHVGDRLLKNLSKGYRQRVGIAQAILGDPEVVILDEPTVGLDPKQIIEIRTLIKNLGRNHTVILSSHILPEVQAVCERIIVVNKGRLVADGATDTLAHDLSQDHRLILRAEGPEREMVHEIQTLPHVVEVYSLGEKEKGVFELSVESEPDADIRRDLFALLSRKGWPMMALKNTDLTLEDLFLQLTSSDAALHQENETEEDPADLEEDLAEVPSETEKGGEDQ